MNFFHVLLLDFKLGHQPMFKSSKKMFTTFKGIFMMLKLEHFRLKLIALSLIVSLIIFKYFCKGLSCLLWTKSNTFIKKTAKITCFHLNLLIKWLRRSKFYKISYFINISEVNHRCTKSLHFCKGAHLCQNCNF